ncbi:YwqI/YxiC family protein [Rossellomorea vietnamensis]|uniref:YwqI/YxiC family protein n=1 Tax=Rossellomorea vietnamensis TaxID=218284 RepID=A0ACD4C2X9_9BACI|nr:YwqI/YxiC family protein [Rossellomorea vietnamensis]UXH42989.1 YwqI/YxiC family protein [Rossellomorea vietnamensis]
MTEEIQIVKSEVSSALEELRNTIHSLDASNPQINFTQNKLDLINKLLQIEKNYYQVLNQYKSILQNVQQDSSDSVEELFARDQGLAKRIR